MAPVLLLHHPGAELAIVPRAPRVRDRLLARWSLLRLDEALAAGAAADSSPALTLRAQRLLHPALRARLANDLERLLAEARGGRPRSWAARTDPGAVLAAGPLIEGLARRLRAPGPVAAAGVARARLLLVDGRGPLYSLRPGRALPAAVRTALEALDVDA